MLVLAMQFSRGDYDVDIGFFNRAERRGCSPLDCSLKAEETNLSCGDNPKTSA